MEFEQIILCTDAPAKQGLAYYYFLALRDIIGEKRVVLIDEEGREYGSSLVARARRRIQLETGQLSRAKCLRVMETVKTGKKNVIMLFNNADLQVADIELLANNKDIYLINYLSDHPYGMYAQRQKEVLAGLPFFDLVITFAEDLLPVLYQLGARKVERLPFGYCTYTHLEPSKAITERFPDSIYYFGTWTSAIENWLLCLTDFNLVIEGNSWQSANSKTLRSIGTKAKPNTDHNMAMLAKKAGLVVNFTRATHGCFHTMKTFELTVAGALVLSNYSREQAAFFPADKAMLYFNTKEELRNKVQSYLYNPSAFESIREQAIEYAVPHSYKDRGEKLLAILCQQK